MSLQSSGAISISDIYKEGEETTSNPSSGSNQSLWGWETTVSLEWENEGSTNGSKPTSLSEFYNAVFDPTGGV